MIRRTDGRRWHEGPIFNYKVGNTPITVNVAHSSWAIKGMAATKAVLSVFKEFKGTAAAGLHVLDFGAGSWLRYVGHLRKGLPSPNVYAVEFDEAFRGEAIELRDAQSPHITMWSPTRFRKANQRFDLIVAINVLNTIPEDSHQREVFKVLATRLNPLGKLFIYQRIWAKGESEAAGGIPYGDGWVMPQANHPHHTYHGRAGANWFKEQAEEHALRVIPLETKLSSNNTFIRAWEKPFD